MATPDLDDRELDLIYQRTERTVDVRKINSERDLRRAVEEVQSESGRSGGWASAINKGVFERIENRREELKASALASVKKTMKRAIIGTVKEKIIEAVFNKRSKSSYFIARGAKGRFTKYSKEELNEVIYNARM